MVQCSTVCNVSMFWQKGRQFLSTLASSNKEINVPVLGSISQIFYITVCNVSMFWQKGWQFLSTLASSNKELNVFVLGIISQTFIFYSL